MQQISEKIWKNCDTSMKFCIEVGGKIFGYRDIADSSGDKYGGYFQIMASIECFIKGLLDHGY